jgi:predicted nucleic acid-binding protein
MVTPVNAFWDTSALVPLCLQQPNSARARELAEQFGQVVWWAARVEVSSAISRLHRLGTLKARARQEAIVRLDCLTVEWDEVPPSDAIREQAATLLDLYPLRAADSLQLAAALIWCRNRPSGRNFLCAGARLAEAATQAGFTTLRP